MVIVEYGFITSRKIMKYIIFLIFKEMSQTLLLSYLKADKYISSKNINKIFELQN